ncbi:MAG: UDP-N-acetylmuramoyl-L-alanyl-D-glutamate--2,6-diaminopimelate ligase [Deltaproteobacteria bacterium HGW-Deltaproteobacteria-13]|jgi:UDP-N-acetylmuramoyl-L-alanyl-D-glutamate--2,6-diaminopimelate ligase|nr:MAG: UDP-N-acetylmuramoyl-L-alanyl-D-glutamate--2,6-diaminopimelate ligase [Deltaproteobacteria bacterium HGW-Deltaproteobacteria-13]
MKLARLIEGLDIINISGETSEEASAVCFSADKCSQGALFVAIPGLKNDGHDFIPEAITRGAKFIVYEKNMEFPRDVTAIKVPDSRRALGILAKNYFGNPSGHLALIAVMGTNGKTTITYLLESILKESGLKCGVLGTVNYRYNDKTYPAPNTTPESYEMQKILRDMADDGVTHVIAEVSSHAVDLKRVDDCDFDLGIFTNLTRDHLDYHLTMENYFQAKKRFFTEILPQSRKVYSQKMVINADDQWGRRILQEVSSPALTYGIEGDYAIRATHHELSLTGIKAQINLAGENVSIASPLIGKFNLYNILAAIGAAFILNIPPAMIKRGIENLSNIPGRLEKVASPEDVNIFVDYAHTDDALRRVLQNLGELKKKRIITVFGCGGNRDRGKRPLMGDAATRYSDLTIITSDNPRLEDPMAIIAEIESGIDSGKIQKTASDELQLKNGTHGYTVIPERRAAIEAAIHTAQSGDIVLIAGKGHEDYQILGTRKVPFDDRVVVAQTLKLRSP